MSASMVQSRWLQAVLIVAPCLCVVAMVTYFLLTADSMGQDPGDRLLVQRVHRQGHQGHPEMLDDEDETFEPVIGQLTNQSGNVEEQDALLSYGNSIQCEVGCETGVPCSYESTTDLRVIILAYNNPERLQKCLESIQAIHMGGDDIVIDIWVDRLLGNGWNEEILKLSTHLVEVWQHGMVCIHLHEYHAGDRSQWINAWQPQENSTEIALIIDEDVILSPHIYRWMKPLWTRYVLDDNYSLAGVSPNTDNLRYDKAEGTRRVAGPKDDTVYAYRAMSGGVFAPHPNHWLRFQRWYSQIQVMHRLTNFEIPGFIPENWYQENDSKQLSWELWFVFYCFKQNLYTLYPNLHDHLGTPEVALSYHAGHAGMTGITLRQDGDHLLLREWQPHYNRFPIQLSYIDYSGTMLTYM